MDIISGEWTEEDVEKFYYELINHGNDVYENYYGIYEYLLEKGWL